MNPRRSAIVSACIVVLIVIIMVFLAVICSWFIKKGPAIDEGFKNLTGTTAKKPYEIRILGPDCIGVIAKPMHKSNIGAGADIYNPTESFFKAIEELQKKYHIKYPPTAIIGGSVSGSSTSAIILVVEERR